MITELAHSVHIYARPETKEKLLEFYKTVLGLEAHEGPFVVSLEPGTRSSFPTEPC